jgi:hypothetical protein
VRFTKATPYQKKRTAAARQTARAKWATPRDARLQGHTAQQHEEEQQHGEHQEK